MPKRLADWSGVFPAATTQFHQDQSLDLKATERHLEALLESGVSGLIVLGSLGENTALDPDEKVRVVECAVKTAGGRVPVLSGVAEITTAGACRYVRALEKTGSAGAGGVAGFMVMPAMIYKADEAEALAHFHAVAKATGLPWMLYNNPISYHVDVSPSMLNELAGLKNLVALKESSGNTRRITDIHNEVGDRYAIFTGVDDLVLESAIVGIDGWVAGTGIAFPKENQHFWELTRANKWEEARALYRWFTPLLHLDTHIKFVQYIKLAIQEAGLGKEWVRAPRLPLEGEERARVLRIIRDGIEKRPRLE
ncbi:MAG TPA: dihydrodipicolinate synthase family protein [Planctomycetota bacterium]|nr:dihydrodipicolinate synthase family protein [Planctomycetota bacterium]